VQKKVVEEIDGILGPGADQRITMKDLNEMKYLECCIKEALRLYPSVPVIARQINEDLNIGKVKKKVKLSRYTPWRHSLSTRWG
jgi:cytochrome P450 family 4